MKTQEKHCLWWQLSLWFCKDNSDEKQQFRFDTAKAALLQRKTYAFTVQNSRFWNAKQ
jgi:hypothetical protein